MGNSDLVSYTKLSPNHSGKRNHIIDTITPHCVVGHLSLQTLGNVFQNTNRQASSNYGIDDDGNIGMYVEEHNRSWCTSSSQNDNRAVTIEIASDKTAPYKITNRAFDGLVRLSADICKRNNIPKLLWKADKRLIGKVTEQNITVHRWFANKDCPGAYIYGRLGELADEVNKILLNDKIILPKEDKEFKVKVVTKALNVRKGPGTNYPVVDRFFAGDITTIVRTEYGKGATRWGQNKNGVWISLDFVTKV